MRRQRWLRVFAGLLATLSLGCASTSNAGSVRHDAASPALQQARSEAYGAAARDLETAIPLFRRNTSRFPDAAEAWNDLADALAREGQIHDYLYVEALSCYEKALNLDPSNAIIHYDHAVTLFVAGKTNAAPREAVRAAILAPRDFDVHYFLGRLLGDSAVAGELYGGPESAARYAARQRDQIQWHRTRAFTDRLIQREFTVYYASLRDPFPWTVARARDAADAYAAASAADPSDTTTPYEACLLRALLAKTSTKRCTVPLPRRTLPLLTTGRSP